MANREYAGTPADFAIALGALTDLIGESGSPIEDPGNPGVNLQGWAVLIPNLPVSFDVYDAEGTQLTDLVNSSGTPSSTISSSSVWETAGQILQFTVNNAPDGDVYLVGTGGTVFTDPTFRLSPVTDDILDQINGLTTTQLADWSDTPASGTNLWPRWVVANNQIEFGPAPDTGSVDWVDILNKPTTFASTWDIVGGKPSAFPPSAHNHDDRYFTEAETMAAIANNGPTLETIPSLLRQEISPGVYAARGTARADLQLVFQGTVAPPIAAAGSGTDFVTTGTAMDGVDVFFRID